MSLSGCQFFYRLAKDDLPNVQLRKQLDSLNCKDSQNPSQLRLMTSSFLFSPDTHFVLRRFWSFEISQGSLKREIALSYPSEEGGIPEHARPFNPSSSTPPPWAWPTDPSKNPEEKDPFESPFDISDIKKPCLARIAGIATCIGFAAFCYFNRGSIVQSINKARELFALERFSFAMV